MELALEAREWRLLGSDKSGGEQGEGGTFGRSAAESDVGEPEPQDLGDGGQSFSGGGVRGELGTLFVGWVSPPRTTVPSDTSFAVFSTLSQVSSLLAGMLPFLTFNLECTDL